MAIDLAIGERTEGPLFATADGKQLDRHGAARVARRVTQLAGIAMHVSPHTLRHAFITAALDTGVPLRDVQEAASHLSWLTIRGSRLAHRADLRVRGVLQTNLCTNEAAPTGRVSPRVRMVKAGSLARA
jgi:integrase